MTYYANASPLWAVTSYWARPLYQDVRAQIGFVSGDLIHLWHGDIQDRGTFDRHRRFAEFEFNPAHDLALERSGCWRWNSDKPAMHQFVRDDFVSRHEDGRQPAMPAGKQLESAAA